MANPDPVTCTKDTWVLVAEDVTNCTIHKMIKTPKYLHTYVVANDPAPTDLSKAVEWNDSSLICNFAEDSDVYIYAKDAAGKVRVDS